MWQLVHLDPLGGQASWLLARQDARRDVGCKKRELQRLAQPLHVGLVGLGDGFERRARLQRIVPEMRAGEVVDQHRIKVCGDRADDDFGFHAAFADRECGGGGKCGFMIGICI